MDRDAYLLHKVHLAKLADISADIVSAWSMWKRRPRPSHPMKTR
jgi:hypothetical protein